MKGIFSFKTREIRKKGLVSLVILFAYMAFCHIPLPFVNDSEVAPMIFGLRGVQFNVMDAFLGKQFDSFNVMTIGVIPFLSTYTLLGLLASPKNTLNEFLIRAANTNGFYSAHRRKGYGRKERYYNNEQLIIRGLVLGLSLLLSFGLMLTGGKSALQNNEWYVMPVILILMALGSLLCIVLSDLSARRGLIEGSAVIILANVLMSAVKRIDISKMLFFLKFSSFGERTVAILLSFAIPSLIIIASVLILSAERRVPIKYGKYLIGRRMYGGQTIYIPLSASNIYEKLSAPIVLYIFIDLALYILLQPFPQLFVAFIWFMSSPYSIILLSIFVLSYMLLIKKQIFDTDDIAKNLYQNNGRIPGIRTEKQTSDYLRKIHTRLLVIFTTMFIAIIVLPGLIFRAVGMQIWFNPTVIFVLAEFAIRWKKRIDIKLIYHNYKGFQV